MPEWLAEMVRYGPLGLFAVAVCWASWRMIGFIGHKLFDDKTGLATKWVENEIAWRTKLTERLENQQQLCATHADSLHTLNEIMNAAKEQRTIGNSYLQRLVEIHEAPGGIVKGATLVIDHTAEDVRRMKQAAVRACKMCREIADRELPNSSSEVDRHCDEIERIIGESK